ncbi:DUF3450 domain-containing protein [Akkermansiaceae bacterium]|nr:DUF3450 domain-containing protein [Akkermansiaceae bacterium]
MFISPPFIHLNLLSIMNFRRLIFYSLLLVQYAPADSADPTVSRELIRQWVKTEQLISEEATEWKADKQSMQDLLEIYKKELGVLDAELSANKKVDNSEVTADVQSYQEAKQVIVDSLPRLKSRLLLLSNRFPTPLLTEIKADLEVLRLSSSAATSRETLKSMISVLNAAGSFNRKVTLAEETRELEGGKKMIVDVIYLGLCRAYYVTAKGNVSGVGIPSVNSVNGWQWSPDPSISNDVRRAIRIYKKETQPDLIELPVQILTVKNQ